MKITLPKLKIEDLLFYIAYGIFLITGILSKTFYFQSFSNIYNVIKYACIGILLFKELISHQYNLRSLFIGVVFVVLVVVTRSQSSLSTVTYILIFVFCARDVNFKGIIRFSAWTSLLTVLFVIISTYMGVIPNYTYSGARVRQYLGFLYSLYAPAFLLNITCLFIYLKKESIRWISLIALAGFNLWMYFMTRSRLSFGLSMLIILAAGFLKLFPKFFEHKHMLCMIMVSSFILCFGISMYFTVTYDASVNWQRQLNQTLENRLSLGQSALKKYGISWLGQDIQLVGNGLDKYGNQNTTDTYNYVDSFYEQTLLRYGIIFEVIMLGLLTYTIYYFYKRGDYWLLVWLTIIAGRGIVESTMELWYCSYWFAISVVLFSSIKGNIKENN